MISVSPSKAARHDQGISLLFRKRRHGLVDSELDAQEAISKLAQICPFWATCWTSQWSNSRELEGSFERGDNYVRTVR